MRMTVQRKLILEEVQSRCDHPTATEVFQNVRERLPHVGLGTVYRTLELLSREGLIATVETPGQPMRFDRDIQSHAHIRCRRCGRVADVPIPPLSPQITTPAASHGWSQCTAHIDFEGLCPQCTSRHARPRLVGLPSTDLPNRTEDFTE